MITWMQKKKKYLIVVLWITVISFVGAGFIGWGTYSYGKKAKNVALVGDVEVSIAEFRSLYSNIYSYYNEIMQGNMSDSQKKELENLTLQNLVQRALLLNYAKEIGLSTTDEEVAKAIVSNKMFLDDGNFSEEAYLKYVTQKGYKKSQFEADIKKDITVSKLTKLLSLPSLDLENEVISAYGRLKDRLEYKILRAKPSMEKPSLKEQKEYYKKNKSLFQSEPTFDFSYIKTKFDDITPTQEQLEDFYNKNTAYFLDANGSTRPLKEVKQEVLRYAKDMLTRRDVLKKSVAWKKNELTPTSLKAMPMRNDFVPFDAFEKADKQASLKASKAIKIDDGYLIFKIDKKNMPIQLSFDAVKARIVPILQKELARKTLEKTAKAQEAKFQGKKTRFVGLTDFDAFVELNQDESSVVLKTIFSSKNSKGFVSLPQKIVLYRVLEQKMFAPIENLEQTKKAVSNLKSRKILDALLKDLGLRFAVQIY